MAADRGLLPNNGHRGGQLKDHRIMIDGILWCLSDGGALAQCARALRTDAGRHDDWSLFAIDGT
jgi:hypothetical protein